MIRVYQILSLVLRGLNVDTKSGNSRRESEESLTFSDNDSTLNLKTNKLRRKKLRLIRRKKLRLIRRKKETLKEFGR